MTKIAFMGLGLMGRPMAANLIEAGHELTLWNRSPGKAGDLLAAGAVEANSPLEAVQGAEAVFTMLSDGKAVGDLLFRQGVAEALPRGALVIDCSSIAPAEARDHAARLAERGVGQLDAPVSGGPSGAEAASLAIMVGGEAADWERGRPLLEALGNPTLIGPPGAGQVGKLGNQIIVALAIGAVAEALLLADEGGADAAALRKAMTGGLADSKVLQIHGQRMLDRTWLPGGACAMHLKDMDNVLAEAKAIGLTLPLAERARELFARLAEHRGPDVDHSGLLLEIERLNPGHRLGKKDDVLPPGAEKAR